MKKLPKRPKLKRPQTLYVIIALILVLCGLFYYYILKDLPSPTKLSSYSASQSTQIYDRNGTLLYTIYGNRNQTFVPLSKIPKNLQNATIAIEDKSFYQHGAIDLRGIVRAAYSIAFHKQVQGGSTLTQQLVKNSLLTQQQTIPRKLKEIVLAFATEVLYSKSKILEMYLNQSPYGGTAWGVEAASEMYFGKHVWQLDLAQCAMLAGLPQAPSSYSPYGANPQLGKQRQLEVLQQMYEQNYITKAQYNQAANEQLHYQKIADNILAPHFVLYVRDLLTQKYGEQMVEQGGLKVITSLDLKLQNFAQSTVANSINALPKSYNVSNGAALITDPKTGEILAMIGSKDYFDVADDGNVNVTTALRQPGSSIKPINYALGILNGYGANTPFIDEHTCFGGKYCPVNYDGKFHGVVSMRQALANSINIPAVKMLEANTVPAMIATASAMGINTFTDPSRYGLSLTLGGGEVRMTDMAVAYGVFANGGYRVDLHPILKVTDKNGNVLEQYQPTDSPIFGQSVLPPGVTYIISNILADNQARTMEFGADSPLYIPGHTVSVKTGTTNDFRDNWTDGYTKDYVVVTWVGNDDNSPMTGLVSGITGAAPIWHALMSHLVDGQPNEPLVKPDDVVTRSVCDFGNASTTPGTPPPSQPTNVCPIPPDLALSGTPARTFITQQNVWIDKTTNDLASPGETNNVEQRPEVIATDPTGAKYCMTCAHPSPTPTPTP